MKRALAVILALSFICVVGTPADATTNTVTFVSGAGWSSYADDPTTTPGSYVGPAQTVCLNAGSPSPCPVGAVQYGFGGSGWGADLSAISGASWVWGAGVTGATTPAELADYFFTKTFTLGGSPTGAIWISADDNAVVFVNGVMVGEVGSTTNASLSIAAQSALTQFDLTSSLHAGSNTITIQGRNGVGAFVGCSNCSYAQHPAGVVFGGSITSSFYNWAGFRQPINDTAHTGLYESKFKRGSSIPVKFQITDDAGVPIQLAADPTFQRSANRGTCDSATASEPSPDGTSTAGTSYRWDAEGQQYIYNFSTKGLTVGEYRIWANLDDGSHHYVDICLA